MQPKIPVNLISRFLTQINTRIDIFTTQNHTKYLKSILNPKQ